MSDERLSRRRPSTAFRSLLITLVAVAAVFAATASFALDVPPTPSQWFTDTAGIVPADQAAALNEKLRAFEQQSGVQFIIYVFPALGGEAVEDFTIRCVQRWKVGNKKYDNGLVLFVFVKEKKVRIEVGYGLEGTITDALSAQVIRDAIGPKFRAGDYAGGLNAAADLLMARITRKEPAVAPVNPASGSPRGASGGRTGIDPFFLIVIAVLFFLFIMPMLRRRRGGGGGGCSGCFIPWMLLGGGGGTTFGGGSFGGGGGGGFSGGGGSFVGGGATGGW
ncbi:MAG: methanol dehydrogenase [Acidobacteria bacterium]|nr:methanol dehydrogenase [Acidobacteriota bacterium]